MSEKYAKLNAVIQFSESLCPETKSQAQAGSDYVANEEGYIRKPGILKRKMVMAEDFDETPECFKEYM